MCCICALYLCICITNVYCVCSCWNGLFYPCPFPVCRYRIGVIITMQPYIYSWLRVILYDSGAGPWCYIPLWTLFMKWHRHYNIDTKTKQYTIFCNSNIFWSQAIWIAFEQKSGKIVFCIDVQLHLIRIAPETLEWTQSSVCVKIELMLQR